MELVIVLSFCSLLFSNVYGIRVSQKKCDEYRKMRPQTSEEFNENDEDAALNEFPFMAKIENGTHSCNGILISENFVLSSATCDRLGNKHISLGYSDGESHEDAAQSQRLDVINEFVYPKFSRYDRSFNIRLLQLNESVKFDEYIQPACLPQSRSANSQQFIEVSWGVTNVRNNIGLYKVKMDFISNKNCKEKYDSIDREKYIRYIDDTRIFCAGTRKGNREICAGHTGAALLSNDVFDEIQGISSVGFRCNSSIPVIFVRLSAYIDWIENIVWPIDTTTTESVVWPDESTAEMVTDSPNSVANSFQLKNIEIFFIAICILLVSISHEFL